MPCLTASELEKRNQARTLYAAFIINQQDLNNKSTARPMQLLQSDLATTATGTTFISYEEQQIFISNSASITPLILAGNKLASGSTSGLTRIDFTGIHDDSPIETGELDDAFVPIPMGGMAFNFFGTNYSNSITWYSNNALVFGQIFGSISISRDTAKSILIGNYDRVCESIYYSNTSGTYSITKLVINFWDYFNDPTPYKYQIRLIKENVGTKRQFVEVCVISSPPSPGYSSYSIILNPDRTDASGNPIDTRDEILDQTKRSPYNITNGTSFLNPCGTTFSAASPPAGTSFVFASDSTGTNWTFTNNSHVDV
jgi:hypothetical protein